jgi:hypothetical protein
MGSLPFLVVYGGWIAALLVAACAGLGLALVRWWRLRRERAAVSTDVEARVAGVSGLVEGPAAVRGTLRGHATTLAPVAPIFGVADLGAAAHDHAASVTLDVDGERVELRGPIAVIRGTTAAASGWRRLPAGTPAELGNARARGPHRLDSVRDGDEVIVQGTLSRAASGEPDGDYRASAGSWVLGPVGDEPAIAVTAARPAIAPPRLGPVALAIYAACFGLVGYGALAAIGAGLTRRTDEGIHVRADTAIAPFSALAIASALPHARARALEELSDKVADDFVRTDATMRMRFHLARLRGGCAAEAGLQLEEERYDEALATATSCGATEARANALIYLGRYAEAVPLLPANARGWPNRAALVAIATGRWRDAAAAADAVAARVRDEGPASDDTQQSLERLGCLAAWFRRQAGDPTPLEKAAAGTAPMCRLVRALALPSDQKLAAFEALSGDDHTPIEVSLAAGDLRWASGPGSAASYEDVDLFDAIALIGGRGGPTDRRVPFARAALASRADTAPDRFTAYGELAALEEIRGDTSAALADLDRGTHSVPPDRPDLGHDLDGLRAAIELHTAAPQIAAGPDPHPAIAEQIELRDGRMPDTAEIETLEGHDVMVAAVRAALAGDGGPLADVLSRYQVMWDEEVGYVLAVLPHVTRHRAELAAALHWFHADYGSSIDEGPLSIVEHAMLRRDLARLAGDEPEARRWQAVIDHQLPVLLDPQKMTALLLWESA